MADNHADPSPGQLFAQHPGAGMVFLAFNPLADPHVMIHGHQQHVLARQNHVPGQERAFLALGVFFHLHQHVLPRQKRRGAVDLMKALLFPNGQKAVLGKAQLHECRLDLRQHPFHPAQKQRAHQTFTRSFLPRVFQQAFFAQKRRLPDAAAFVLQQRVGFAHASSSMGTSLPSLFRASISSRKIMAFSVSCGSCPANSYRHRSHRLGFSAPSLGSDTMVR